MIDHHVNVFAIDPGGTTGWALALDADPALLPGIEPDLQILSAQIMGDEHQQCFDLAHIYRAASKRYGHIAVVIEDFIPRIFNQERHFLSPVRITAGFTQLLWADGVRWELQQPSLAKSTISDDYLRSIVQHSPGKPHANDAVRHAITYLRRVKQIPEIHEGLLEPIGLE